MTGQRPGRLERRRGDRIPMPATGGAVSVVGGRIVNVGCHGMMMESPVPLERDAVLKLRVVVSGRQADIQARVVVCRASAPTGRRSFQVGLEFVEIPAEVLDLLKRIVAAHAQTARTA